jgi:hypothetical protein
VTDEDSSKPDRFPVPLSGDEVVQPDFAAVEERAGTGAFDPVCSQSWYPWGGATRWCGYLAYQLASGRLRLVVVFFCNDLTKAKPDMMFYDVVPEDLAQHLANWTTVFSQIPPSPPDDTE